MVGTTPRRPLFCPDTPPTKFERLAWTLFTAVLLETTVPLLMQSLITQVPFDERPTTPPTQRVLTSEELVTVPLLVFE